MRPLLARSGMRAVSPRRGRPVDAAPAPPPPRRPDLVDRPALAARLTALSRRKLTLLAAPTGYGKTTLLAGWAAAESRPVAWLSLTAAEGDPARFWARAAGALAAVRPELAAPAAAFGTRRVALLERALPLLLNELAETPEQIVLVLDDYHLISRAGCHEALAAFLERLPDTIRVVVSTRYDPPLPLARLRARGELGELR